MFKQCFKQFSNGVKQSLSNVAAGSEHGQSGVKAAFKQRLGGV